uniref:Uncharacterized protein n=1 Tax=Salmonella phage vB_SE127_1PH123 TaxID=3236705 RepID=A0AB39C4Y9_9VIRU
MHTAIASESIPVAGVHKEYSGIVALVSGIIYSCYRNTGWPGVLKSRGHIDYESFFTLPAS